MTIRFEVCPYHEPHPAGFERTMVVDDWSRRFKCAACGAEGFLDAEDQFPMFDEFWKDFDEKKARIGKLEPLADPAGAKKVKSVMVFEVNDDMTVVTKCFDGEDNAKA